MNTYAIAVSFLSLTLFNCHHQETSFAETYDKGDIDTLLSQKCLPTPQHFLQASISDVNYHPDSREVDFILTLTNKTKDVVILPLFGEARSDILSKPYPLPRASSQPISGHEIDHLLSAAKNQKASNLFWNLIWTIESPNLQFNYIPISGLAGLQKETCYPGQQIKRHITLQVAFSKQGTHKVCISSINPRYNASFKVNIPHKIPKPKIWPPQKTASILNTSNEVFPFKIKEKSLQS